MRNPAYIRSDARELEEGARNANQKSLETVARLIADLATSVEEINKRIVYLERLAGR